LPVVLLDGSVGGARGGDSKPPAVGVQPAVSLRESQREQPAGKHIMISYCWSDQAMVLKVSHVMAV